jgi:molybdopterin/thiamine biosynthesis adenylyltransferase
MSTSFAFSYEEMVGRNAGLLSAIGQTSVRDSRVLVCGAGGAGGAALQALARAGVGAFTIADPGLFDRASLNRQLFATADTVGKLKASATADALLRINPSLTLETLGADWVERLDELLPVHSLVICAMDDVAAGIALYRKAREHGATVIGSYDALFPSVTVTRPADPRPEERLGYPTTGANWRIITDDELVACRMADALYAMVHSSAQDQLDESLRSELLAGTRPRPSLAPFAMLTGALMALEAIKLLTHRDTVDCRGVFLNPWTLRIERPKPAPIAWVLERVARRKLQQMVNRET